MQEGSLHCDVNISVRPIRQSEFGTKVRLNLFFTHFMFIQSILISVPKRMVSGIVNAIRLISPCMPSFVLHEI